MIGDSINETRESLPEHSEAISGIAKEFYQKSWEVQEQLALDDHLKNRQKDIYHLLSDSESGESAFEICLNQLSEPAKLAVKEYLDFTDPLLQRIDSAFKVEGNFNPDKVKNFFDTIYALEYMNDDLEVALFWYKEAGHAIMNKFCRNPEQFSIHDLTDDEIDDIISYSGDIGERTYCDDTPESSLEEKIALFRTTVDEALFYKDVQQSVEALDSFLSEQSLPIDTILIRDMQLGKDMQFPGLERGKQDLPSGEPGKYLKNAAFTSTSINPFHCYQDLLEEVKGEVEDTSVRLFLFAPAETPGAYIDHFASGFGEYEFLLPRSSSIRIEQIRELDTANFTELDHAILTFLPKKLIYGEIQLSPEPTQTRDDGQSSSQSEMVEDTQRSQLARGITERDVRLLYSDAQEDPQAEGEDFSLQFYRQRQKQ
ncbi:ADP-ribosyltransferase [Dictyobacter arantiisoli]|uniref:ADP ribosyltransferase domain-containing protein n=1 Tax=Dictyobacter arantiisoli TaxID=2014874 RepID=A0A5A5TK96_9CHLR|nr:ADP-ribosyltransferase [Dictyobacter arantiisoli]GCF11314.1 hypothetical protein KDI_48780 [Dictyobacter arantiisoli]